MHDSLVRHYTITATKRYAKVKSSTRDTLILVVSSRKRATCNIEKWQISVQTARTPDVETLPEPARQKPQQEWH